MTPARTGKAKGNYEFDRVFPDVGRIRRSSGTKNLREFHRRDAILTKLFETSQLEILRAFKAGKVSIEQLVEQDRRGRGGESLAQLRLREPLVDTFNATLPLMGRKAGTRERYAESFRKLARLAKLTAATPISALATMDWHALRAQWTGSPANWNRMRTAVSRFLSLVTGEKFGAARLDIVKRIPLNEEPKGRMPDITPAQFLDAFEQLTDDDVRAAVMVLVLTGMRVGEYLSLTRDDLQLGNRRIRIPMREGNKTGDRLITIAEDSWGWVLAGVPFAGLTPPAQYKAMHRDPRYRRIRMAWRTACEAAGVKDRRLHDLRHSAGQWASDQGTSDRAIQTMFGHSDPRMTARYTGQQDSKAATAAIGKALKLARAN